MAIETPEKPDDKTPDTNPKDQPGYVAPSFLAKNGKTIAFVIGALIVLAALVMGLRHG